MTKESRGFTSSPSTQMLTVSLPLPTLSFSSFPPLLLPFTERYSSMKRRATYLFPFRKVVFLRNLQLLFLLYPEGESISFFLLSAGFLIDFSEGYRFLLIRSILFHFSLFTFLSPRSTRMEFPRYLPRKPRLLDPDLTERSFKTPPPFSSPDKRRSFSFTPPPSLVIPTTPRTDEQNKTGSLLEIFPEVA